MSSLQRRVGCERNKKKGKKTRAGCVGLKTIRAITCSQSNMKHFEASLPPGHVNVHKHGLFGKGWISPGAKEISLQRYGLLLTGRALPL